MKKLFIALLVVVALGAGALLALPHFLPMSKVEQIVKDKVREKTGRDLTFSNAKVYVFPDIGIQLSDVAFSNAAWAKDKNMAEISKLDISLALKPLFDHRIEVKRFVLKSPVIHLEKNKDGKANWEFAVEKGASPAAAVPSSPANTETAKTAQNFQFSFGEMKISDGILSFADDAKGTAEKIDGLNINVTYPDLQSAFQLDGALNYRQKRVSLALDIQKPMDLANGKTSPGTIDLKTEDATAKIEGDFATQGTRLKGDIDADISSLAKLAAWAGGGAEQKMPFEKISFKSHVTATTETLKLEDAALSLDDISAKGSVDLGFAGKPEITARLALNKLDLDRFMGGKKEPGAAASGGGKQETPASTPSQEWDATPIDFSALKKLNADLVLDTQGFSLKGADVGPSKLTATLKDGVLHFTSSEATLFDGKFSSSLDLNAAAASTMAFKFNMAGVQAKPVLTTFAHFTKLSGTTDAQVSVTSSGDSQKAIIGALAGDGSVTFKNGALEGIDLANIAKMLQSRLADMGVGAGKTDFVAMGGTFTIAQGIVTNKDFSMKGPLVQATGAGTVDLPQKTVQYRVMPVLTASSDVAGAKGIGIPVDIKGPFSNIRIKPDFQGVIQKAIKDPAALRQQGKDLFQNIKKGGLRGLLGGGKNEASPQQPAAPPQ